MYLSKSSVLGNTMQKAEVVTSNNLIGLCHYRIHRRRPKGENGCITYSIFPTTEVGSHFYVLQILSVNEQVVRQIQVIIKRKSSYWVAFLESHSKYHTNHKVLLKFRKENKKEFGRLWQRTLQHVKIICGFVQDSATIIICQNCTNTSGFPKNIVV